MNCSSGKTSSILTAFLKTDLTYFLYLHNNNVRNFLLDSLILISKISFFAERQGADFIFQCIKRLLKSDATENPTKEELNLYLEDKLGHNHKCLFHLDEHRSMCPRRGSSMQLLAEVSRAIVVATYTDLPDLPAEGSSYDGGACCKPVMLPILDINKVMYVVPEELRFEHACTNSRLRSRKLSTLKFRLAVKVRGLGITCVSTLHLRYARRETEVFLAAFQAAAAAAASCNGDVDDALQACSTNLLASMRVLLILDNAIYIELNLHYCCYYHIYTYIVIYIHTYILHT